MASVTAHHGKMTVTTATTFAVGLTTAVESCRNVQKEIKRGWPKVYRGNRHERRKAAALESKR